MQTKSKRVKVKKDFTYSSIIKEALFSYPNNMATTSQIFSYMIAKHYSIFKESNSMTWKSNVRQLLSKNPEFHKIKRSPKQSGPNYWTYKSLEEIKEEEKKLWECLQFGYDDSRSTNEISKYNFMFTQNDENNYNSQSEN